MPNLLIDAGPGCGKTHTIVDAYLYLCATNKPLWITKYPHSDEQIAIYNWVEKNFPRKEGEVPRAAYMAYNKAIKVDIEKKIHKNATVHTHHGWGYSILLKKYGYLKLNDRRADYLVEKMESCLMYNNPLRFEWASSIRFVEKLKIELLTPSLETFYQLQAKYSDLAPFKIHDRMVEQCSRLMQAMKKIDRMIGIDYTDQVWLALWEIKNPMFLYGFVDECQDLSPDRLLLSQKLCENIVFCGDPRQAINAFAGADAHAFDKIRAICQDELPLKRSFRLPPNIIDMANRLKPSANLKAEPSKKPGNVANVSLHSVVAWAKTMSEKNVLVVCRYNAPLLKVGLQLIREKIPCSSIGDTLAKTLISTVKNRKAKSKTDLLEKLDNYEQTCLRKGSALSKEATKDKFDCIRYILTFCSEVDDFEKTIKKMMEPVKGNYCITLSTVHKAKGLEETHVAILLPPVASSRADTPEMKEQEENLEFVALTRTKRDLYYIVND